MSADINRARRRRTAACNEQGITRKRYKKDRRAARMAAAIKRGYLSIAAFAKEAAMYEKELQAVSDIMDKVPKPTPEEVSSTLEHLEHLERLQGQAGIPGSEAIAEVSFKPTWRLYAAIGLGIVLVLTLVAYLT